MLHDSALHKFAVDVEVLTCCIGEELAILKAEFGHHAEKLDEYEQMRKELDQLGGKISLRHLLTCTMITRPIFFLVLCHFKFKVWYI